MEFNDNNVKHLEFIQSNIARMNQCSFQMKGWMVTIVSALLALYASSVDSITGEGTNMYIFVAIVPTVIFWVLDSYYLQQERKFRGVYNDLIDADLTDPEERKINKLFQMPLDRYNGWKYCLFNVMISITEGLLYVPVIVGLIVAGVLL